MGSHQNAVGIHHDKEGQEESVVIEEPKLQLEMSPHSVPGFGAWEEGEGGEVSKEGGDREPPATCTQCNSKLLPLVVRPATKALGGKATTSALLGLCHKLWLPHPHFVVRTQKCQRTRKLTRTRARTPTHIPPRPTWVLVHCKHIQPHKHVGLVRMVALLVTNVLLQRSQQVAEGAAPAVGDEEVGLAALRGGRRGMGAGA